MKKFVLPLLFLFGTVATMGQETDQNSKKIGIKNPLLKFKQGVVLSSSQGFGQTIEYPRGKTFLIESVNYKLATSTLETSHVRVELYKEIQGEDQLIVSKQFKGVVLQKGWNQLDLSDLNLVVNNKLKVGIIFTQPEGHTFAIAMDGNPIKGKGSVWDKYSGWQEMRSFCIYTSVNEINFESWSDTQDE